MEEDLGGGYSAPGAASGDGDGARSSMAPGSTDGVAISYRLCGFGSTKLLLIPGLACGHAFWTPYSRELTTNSATISNDEKGGDFRKFADDGVQVCTFDNRGVGDSSVPTQKSDYSTTIMAMDALCLIDFLGWKQVHVCGHSMGAMIGFKLAAMVPDRILSLTLISITGGGVQCLPKLHWRSFSIAYRFLVARTLEQRILVDLDTHYTQDYLNEITDDIQRKDELYKEYLKNMEASGLQPKAGLSGHIHSCWTHEVKNSDLHAIRSAGFPVSVIHGKNDVIAQFCYGKRLAKRLGSRFWALPGGHLVTHQNTQEVVRILTEVIQTSCLQQRQSDLITSNFVEEENSGIWKAIQRLVCICLCLVAFTLWLLLIFAL